MHPEHRRCDDPGVHGGHSVRKDEQAQAENSNVAILAERCYLSEGRRALFDVPSRRYEEKSHNRSCH